MGQSSIPPHLPLRQRVKTLKFIKIEDMEELSLHIEYLLLRHDCVIVPGLGAFIARRHGAIIDHERGIILPPTREVGFNREVHTDDGLLAHSISRRERVSFEEGRQKMLCKIEEVKDTLLHEGEATLGHVGTLKIGQENTITFHPYRRGDSMATAMGRYLTHLLHEEETPAKDEETKENNLHPHPVEEAEEPNNEVASSEEADPIRARNPYYIIKIRKSYAHVAAGLFFCLLLALSMILPSSSRNDTHKAFASVVPIQTSTEKDRPAAPAKPQPKVMETPAEENNTEELKETEPTHPYYLIVATFRTQEEADNYIAASGAETKLIHVGGRKLHRVAVESAEKKEALQGRLNDKNFKTRYPGAWIWKSDQ